MCLQQNAIKQLQIANWTEYSEFYVRIQSGPICDLRAF